jgi:hypothetical protein
MVQHAGIVLLALLGYPALIGAFLPSSPSSCRNLLWRNERSTLKLGLGREGFSSYKLTMKVLPVSSSRICVMYMYTYRFYASHVSFGLQGGYGAGGCCRTTIQEARGG